MGWECGALDRDVQWDHGMRTWNENVGWRQGRRMRIWGGNVEHETGMKAQEWDVDVEHG